MKVVIVGGGIIGSAIAYYVQKAGAQAVVVERGEIGGEASGAAAGMLIPPASAVPPGPFRDICLASVALYPQVIEDVQVRSGIDVECTESGILVVAESEATVGPLQAHARRQDENGVPTQWIGRDEVHLLEPGLAPHIIGAAYSPKEKHVNPGLMTQALARSAQQLGAELWPGAALTGFLRSSSRVTGVSTSLGDLSADAVLLATGPWTGVVAARAGFRVQTPPMRGQMIAYRSNAVRHAVWGDHGYLVPKPRGFLFAGATVEDVGFRKTNTGRAVSGLKRMAADLAPGLRHAEVASTWAGLRPGSPDGWPIIGRVPGRENLYMACGHFRNGILLAPITGKLVADLVLEGRADPLLAAFGAERFAG